MNEKGSVLLIFIVLVVILAAGFIVYSKVSLPMTPLSISNSTKPFSTSSSSGSLLKTQYQNPFAASSSSYANPFASSNPNNPFDSLK